VRRALADAGISGAGVGYVECHGTGTALGDPIEVEALAAAFATDGANPWIGSIKANIGHTEAAAGVAGLLKVVLALRAGVVPATPGANPRNPRIRWDSLPLRVADAPTPWSGPRTAGVSSFGISGTNVYVVVDGPPARADAATPSQGIVPFVVSAASRAALDANVAAVRTIDPAASRRSPSRKGWCSCSRDRAGTGRRGGGISWTTPRSRRWSRAAPP
jgi:acyl transferase domain-containing protein